MTTIAQVAAKIVNQKIDMDYVKDCGFKSVSEVYRAEYGYNGLSDKSCKDYLLGLPTVCSVPFMNHEILDILEKEGITRKTESGKMSAIEQYWNACGAALHKHIRHENNSK